MKREARAARASLGRFPVQAAPATGRGGDLQEASELFVPGDRVCYSVDPEKATLYASERYSDLLFLDEGVHGIHRRGPRVIGGGALTLTRYARARTLPFIVRTALVWRGKDEKEDAPATRYVWQGERHGVNSSG